MINRKIVGVLDYGAGNLLNVCNALQHIGHDFFLVKEPAQIKDADIIILPGVGAFKVAMEQLMASGFIPELNIHKEKGGPIIGICLGMQLLFSRSFEFGEASGLGYLQGDIIKIPSSNHVNSAIKVPHVGWNKIRFHRPAFSPELLVEHSYVYFVHSYMASLGNEEDLIASCEYYGIEIPAVVGKDNVIGCQFHPEKSGEYGLKLLEKSIEIFEI